MAAKIETTSMAIRLFFSVELDPRTDKMKKKVRKIVYYETIEESR